MHSVIEKWHEISTFDMTYTARQYKEFFGTNALSRVKKGIEREENVCSAKFESYT